MTRPHRRILTTLLNCGLIALLTLLPGLGVTKPVVAAAPDFTFSLNYKGEFTTEPSYLIRNDGTLPWTGAAYGPYFELYGWVGNVLLLKSLNGFQGNVNLSLVNAPPGIILDMPATVFVPNNGQLVVIAVRLRAATSIPLGTTIAGVQLRGVSGSIIHTQNVPTFTIVHVLPCTYSC